MALRSGIEFEVYRRAEFLLYLEELGEVKWYLAGVFLFVCFGRY